MINQDTTIKDLCVQLQLYSKEQMTISCNQLITKERWHYGSIYFTRREVQTLSLYLRGCRSKQIAYFLNISDKTVDTHLRRIKDKVDAENRYQIVQKAMQHGFIELMFQLFSD